MPYPGSSCNPSDDEDEYAPDPEEEEEEDEEEAEEEEEADAPAEDSDDEAIAAAADALENPASGDKYQEEVSDIFYDAVAKKVPEKDGEKIRKAVNEGGSAGSKKASKEKETVNGKEVVESDEQIFAIHKGMTSAVPGHKFAGKIKETPRGSKKECVDKNGNDVPLEIRLKPGEQTTFTMLFVSTKEPADASKKLIEKQYYARLEDGELKWIAFKAEKKEPEKSDKEKKEEKKKEEKKKEEKKKEEKKKEEKKGDEPKKDAKKRPTPLSRSVVDDDDDDEEEEDEGESHRRKASKEKTEKPSNKSRSSKRAAEDEHGKGAENGHVSKRTADMVTITVKKKYKDLEAVLSGDASVKVTWEYPD